MKNKILSLLFLALTLPCLAFADSFVNLTPTPKVMSVGQGELVLPKDFVVSTAGLSKEMAAEADKFVGAFNAATGYNATVSTTADKALFSIKQNGKLDKEGYTIDVQTTGVAIEANGAIGLYYAFQSLKKVLPANVMAGVKDAKVSKYALPIVNVNDQPRFGYRGFMLDASRHFFSVKEIKRVLEVMSYYKMNRFHWHLTDDQGWRIEIKKYPKLTSVGSVSDNSYMVDMHEGDYWLNKPYGPFFYTQKDVQEVVEYAKERHIEIIPEIDMPGHFCAAMAAYPEYSCTPNGHHAVVTNIGGVYNDVLNVANPGAVQFAKDILTEIMDMFPGEYIHIGGDECPTTAWENNAECKAKMEEMNLKSFRELQSHFIKDMAEHVKANGRKISVWNEAISAGGADTKTIQETGATVYCWVGADGAVAKASQLGMNHIYTPQIPWYINRKQSTDPNEPVGAGHGTDNLEVVYKQRIPVNNANYFAGVQATFWSEYVAFGEYLEYLMLPRLVAIAEAGWTPQTKMNFDHFCKRISADSQLYDYNNYSYGKHYINKNNDSDEKVMPQVSTENGKYWYRIVTRAEKERTGKCMELLRADAPLIAQQASKGAEEGRLWTNAQATEGDAAYDYQFWSLEEDATRKGHYALVCKAQPKGSVSPEPTAKSGGGRWIYDNSKKHYNFVLADNGYGKDGEVYFYSIRCDQVDGLWLNASLGGQGFAVNLYNKPSDGNGGLWKFVPEIAPAEQGSLQELLDEVQVYLTDVQTYTTPEEKRPGYFDATATAALQKLVKDVDLSTLSPAEQATFEKNLKAAYQTFLNSFGYLEKDLTYCVSNAVEGFNQVSLYDQLKNSFLGNTAEVWTDNAWKVTESKINEDHTQTVKLVNTQTERFVGAAANKTTGHAGYLVSVSKSAAEVLCTFSPVTKDFVLSVNGKNLFPLTATSSVYPGAISSGSTTQKGNAVRRQGAAWSLVPVRVVTFDCYDQDNQPLGTFRRSWPLHEEEGAKLTPPAIKNFEFVETKDGKSIYKRTHCTVNLVLRDATGALISKDEQTVAYGNTYTVAFPELPYYSFDKANYKNGEQVKAKADLDVTATYTTNAYNGVKKLGQAVKEVKAGHSYVLYDASPNAPERKGYRNVNADLKVMRNLNIEETDPNHTWLLEASGKNFKVKNAYRQLYVPLLNNSQPVHLSATAGVFTFSLNADGETWKIKGSNGVCWDGLGDGSLVGWNDPGHAMVVYEYYAQPYFTVSMQAVDTEGKVLGTTPKTLVKAGEAYAISTQTYEGYTLKEIQGEDAAKAVSDNLDIKVIYESDALTGIEEVATDKTVKGFYDLSGRRLQRVSHKGIYIINGQKVMVK